jgi:hypothetical protein
MSRFASYVSALNSLRRSRPVSTVRILVKRGKTRFANAWPTSIRAARSQSQETRFFRVSSSACVPASTFRFLPAAELELDDAAQWQEDRRDGLGLEFLTTVREKMFALMESPDR